MMANSEVHHDRCFKPINKMVLEEASFSMKTPYPASVTEISAMLVHARKESSEDIAETSGVGLNANRVRENNSAGREFNLNLNNTHHQCGSFFAKCNCGYEDHLPVVGSSKSSPGALLNQRDANSKRLSSPEIDISEVTIRQPNVCLKAKTPGTPSPSSSVIKANVFLNHPEITFPIPVEVSKEDYNNHSIPAHLYPEIKHKFDYHKATALAYEHQKDQHKNTKKDEEAERFFKEFGLFGPMGNGITSFKNGSRNSLEENISQIRKNSKTLDFKPMKKVSTVHVEDYEHLKMVEARLKKDITDLEMKYTAAQIELHETKNLLSLKENEVLKLQREVHKLKSVLHQTTTCQIKDDILTSIQEQHAMANRLLPILPTHNETSTAHHKKQGVSAESSEKIIQSPDIKLDKYEKDFRSKQLIKDAIMDNAFLKNLDTSQIREIVDAMEPREYPSGSYIVRQGHAGVHLFVSAEGDLEVLQDDKILGHMGSGKAFGELAILYNCTRTASIRALTDSKVWRLDRKVFQKIMKRTGLQRLQDNLNFLKSVPLLANLSDDVLSKIADVLEVEFYPAGAYIIRQDASGDTFFIISSGNVKVTQRLPAQLEEEEIRTLGRGDYFGEQALLKEDCRTASVVALRPGVECLTLDRDSFNQLLGSLSEIKEKDYGDEERLSRPALSEQQEFDYINLDDLDVVATLGIGGFGRVELVQYVKDPSLTFALKCLKKQHIVDTQQQEHIYSERNIMLGCRSDFIARLYGTYRDSKYVYMLLEACLGGEVWTILRDRGCFDDHTCRFISGCVIEAFEYLHARGIIYRDLKPENLLLDSQGYVKLVDFGFSKKMGYSSKTWTFCGTPEYVAPETILNKGHDRAVDYWALGILMFELLTGNPPFTAADPMKTYNLILKGIDMIDFAKYNVGRSAQSLIKKLCRDMPSERLGYQRGGITDIKKHKWFQSFDWDGLVARSLISPIQQPVRSPTDTGNFDCFAKDNDIPPDESSDWDINF
ncbi:cGMP-dependent protein kinase, isozyme 1 isoform X2 [Euwallacea similis]|uniref:cGMP-dependent protein kinase, isozyme 1 isoform X2 n=1 Tax=Euwallacea similis TaxID=1736056 RepID=UPI00344BDF6C